MKTKIAFFELEEWETAYVKKHLKNAEPKFFREHLNSKNVNEIRDFDAIGIFIYSIIDKKILNRLPKLKMIASMSTGYDHIDLKECAKRNIAVCNVPFYGENTVAEHTFALILSLSRKIYPSIQTTRKGIFCNEGLRGFDLKGKTIGLLGTGHISAHVARIAYGFEMNILGYDVFKNKELEKKYGLKYVSIENLLKNSDIVSLHLPLNDKTEHIINKKNIALMKKNALLINTARGALIDTDALAKALEAGRIAGAGLDVLEEENNIKEEKQLLSHNFLKDADLKTLAENHILLKLNNVIITPHNAFNSNEALQRIIDMTIENIESYTKEKFINKVS